MLLEGLIAKLDDPNLSDDKKKEIYNEIHSLVLSEKQFIRKQEAAALREQRAAERAAEKAAVNATLGPLASIFKKYKAGFKLKYITSFKFKHITNFDFNPYFCTYDLETYKNNDGKACPYLFGIYIPNLGYKAFYGANCVSDA